MNSLKKDIILYISAFTASIIIVMIFSHRLFTPDIDYRVRATDSSVILYSGFLFIIPLFLKIIFRKVDPNGNYSKQFKFQFVIALLTALFPIVMMLNPASVVNENYVINTRTDLYMLYIILKFTTYFSMLLILLKGTKRIISNRIKLKHNKSKFPEQRQ